MQNYVLILLAALLLTADFVFNKLFQRKAGTSIQAGLCFNALLGLATAAIFWVIGGFQAEISLYSVTLACGTALLSLCYNIIGFRIMSGGKMAYYTLFLMSGGMLVPYVWGLLFLNEPFSLLRMAGLLLIAGAIVISNAGQGKPSRSQLLMCVTVFFLNGFLSVISKVHQIETDLPTVSTTAFVMLSGLAKFVFCGLTLAGIRIKSRSRERLVPNKRIWLIVLCSALVSGLSYFFQLVGAENLPATVLYPFVTGGSIVFTTLAGWLVFREKPSAKLWLGVALCVAGTFLFL